MLVGLGEDFGIVFADDYEVFDADAAPAFDVDAGFNADYVVFFDGVFGEFAEVGAFVYFEANTVAEARAWAEVGADALRPAASEAGWRPVREVHRRRRTFVVLAARVAA